MKARLQKLANRIDELSLRERAFLLLALLAACYLVVDQALLTPQNMRAKSYGEQIRGKNKVLEKLRAETQVVMARSQLDPDARVREQIQRLETEMSQLDSRMSDLTVDLIDPRAMARMLEQVLRQETDLELIGVRALPPKPLTEYQGDKAGEDRVLPGVYKHGLEISIRGGYASTVRYLRALEQLPWRFYWDGISYRVEEYPRAHVIITINTLSLDEAWIGI